MSKLRVVDFYCGAGGFSEGFRQAGIKIVKAFDSWETATVTHQENHPDCETLRVDILKIAKLSPKKFHQMVPDTEIIIGSPPCVAFSNSNRSGYANKELAIRLIKAFLTIVARKKLKKGSKLKYWILENVPKSEPFIPDEIPYNELGIKRKGNLKVKVGGTGRYNALDYGSPSKRDRYFCGNFPEPTKSKSSFHPLGEIIDALSKENNDTITDPLYGFELPKADVSDHHYIQHIEEFEWRKAKRLKEDKGFMGKMAFPENMNNPGRTIMATMTHAARESLILAHEDGYRVPTIREIASLMSFPLDYRFYGESKSTKYKQAGNAVSPKMAYALAAAILKKEGLRVQRKYQPIQHADKHDFDDLNGVVYPRKDQPIKKPTAKFKYHIPYFIFQRYRVELTNHHSRFGRRQFKWDAEIHFSQGVKAMKAYTPSLITLGLSVDDKAKAEGFVDGIAQELVTHKEFQNIYRKPLLERREHGLVGPIELLERIAKFFEENYSFNKVNPEITLLSEEPYQLPMPTVLGYYILSKCIKIIDERTQALKPRNHRKVVREHLKETSNKMERA